MNLTRPFLNKCFYWLWNKNGKRKCKIIFPPHALTAEQNGLEISANLPSRGGPAVNSHFSHLPESLDSLSKYQLYQMLISALDGVSHESITEISV